VLHAWRCYHWINQCERLSMLHSSLNYIAFSLNTVNKRWAITNNIWHPNRDSNSPVMWIFCSAVKTTSILRTSASSCLWLARNWSLAICHVRFRLVWSSLSWSNSRQTVQRHKTGLMIPSNKQHRRISMQLHIITGYCRHEWKYVNNEMITKH